MGSASSGHSAWLGRSWAVECSDTGHIEPVSWQLCPWVGWGLSLMKRIGARTRGSAGRTSVTWTKAGGLFSFEGSTTGMLGAWVPLCSCSFQLSCIHRSCATRLPPQRKCFFQHAVSHETSSFIVPAFAEHLACQMLLQIKDGPEPKSWVQTPSDFGKVCIPILWLCSIPASFQSYLVTVFIFSCNQKLQRNVMGTEWVDVPWENSKTPPGWRHAPLPWSIYWTYEKDYSMVKNSSASLPFFTLYFWSYLSYNNEVHFACYIWFVTIKMNMLHIYKQNFI